MRELKNKLTKVLLVGAITYITLCNTVLADINGTAIVQSLRFGTVTPITGTCIMNYNTGMFTSDFNNTCPTIIGSTGQYKISADANTLVRITPYTFTYASNLFTFTPSGEVTNGIDTKILTPNNATVIDSGSTGIIDMKVGGTLKVMSPLTTSNSYIVDLEIAIVAQ